MAVSNNNRQVAKNTLILYVRMFVTMAIGMWTSRIVINALGFTDQGIYNVVAGFVGFSSLLTSSISSSINRFITFAIGKSDIGEVNKAVQNGITVQWILAGVIFVIAETIGLWFLLNKLVIPEGREFAAYVIYQLAIISLILNLLTSTDSALILANEQFNIFAYVAIVNSLIALGIGYTIANVGYDRLILYSSLQLVAVLGVRIFYTTYIHKKYPSIKRKFGWHKELFRPIFSFAGWNGIGSGASVLRTSGTSVLLNMFGGPIANTINGIANSVNVLASVFVNDFTSAYSPQIIKRYAAGEYQSLMSFLCQCSKFSFCLIAVIAIPLLFNVEPLLILWLKHIPVGTAIFARLIIIYTIIECISKPLICAKNATGSIRNYQLVVGGILLMTLPLTYVF